MPLSIRDAVFPPGVAPSIVNSIQIQTYLEVTLFTMLVYDSRTPSVWLVCFLPLLTLYQSAHLIKRYVNGSLQYDFMVTVREWQVKYFWVDRSVDVNIENY